MCAGAKGFRKWLVTMAGAICLREHQDRKWAFPFFWDGGSTKTAKPKFLKIRQKSNFGPIVKCQNEKLSEHQALSYELH